MRSLSKAEREAIIGICLDKPNSAARYGALTRGMRKVNQEVGTITNQGALAIYALRNNLVPVDTWAQDPPFTTKRRLTSTEIRLLMAYIESPTVEESAEAAFMALRSANRVWRSIYEALGVNSRPAAVTASYLLGYWR